MRKFGRGGDCTRTFDFLGLRGMQRGLHRKWPRAAGSVLGGDPCTLEWDPYYESASPVWSEGYLYRAQSPSLCRQTNIQM